jgi:hypothetical protein
MSKWCQQCRENGWTMSDRYTGLCVRCAAARKATKVREMERAAPNGGRASDYTETDDYTTVYFPSKADAVAAYFRDGASVGPRESKKRPGMWYMIYEK